MRNLLPVQTERPLKQPFGTGSKTIYTDVSDLTTSQAALLQTGFNFQQLKDGALLVSVPSPIGFVYWIGKAKDFTDCATEYLSGLNIKNVTK